MNQTRKRPNLLVDQEFLPEHSALFEDLLNSVDWDESMRARKTASFGQPYDYSQMKYEVRELPPTLALVAEALEGRLGFRPNNCLLNYYESGENTMGYHSDETEQLVDGTGVVIVSLGSARDLSFRAKADQGTVYSVTLQPGSLLHMGQDVQDGWMHAVRKEEGAGPRISLTWRAVREAT